MAFNPFHSFRRHEKKIIAGLAIVCMGLFVVSSGAGGSDLLNQLGDWFGRRSGSGPRGEVVATLDGKKLDEVTVATIREQRTLVNTYVSMLVGVAQDRMFGQILEQREKVDPVLKQPLEQYASLRFFGRQFGGEFYFAQLSNLQNNIRMARMALESANSPTKNESIRVADKLFNLISRERQRIEKNQESYFGGNPEKLEDNLDFLVWKQQADKLGVVINADGLREALDNEMLFQKLSAEDAKAIDQQMRQRFRNFSVDAVNAALIDEFRVRTAKSTLLGEPAYTRTAPPVAATPDQLCDWYRDVRTQVRVGLIEVPVANFVGKVTETPTEAQLKELYEKYKNTEFDPRSDQPGFKDPRKIKVEWLYAPSDSGFYQELADKSAVFQALRQFGAPAFTGDGTAALALGAILAAHPAVGEAGLDNLYAEYMMFSPNWTSPIAFGRSGGMHDSSRLRAEMIAGLVGGSQAGLLTGMVGMEQQAVVQEMRDRARIGVTAVLNGNHDLAPLTLEATVSHVVPPALTQAALRPVSMERYRELLSRKLMEADMDQFVKEVTERSKKQDRNNVEAFVNEFIHTRKLQRGGTAEAVDRFALTDDPGVTAMRSAFNRGQFSHGTGGDPTGAQFAQFIADGPRTEDGKPSLFSGRRIPTDGGLYLCWRSEDREPKQVPFDQAKGRVLSAWLFDKARVLAKADADRIAAEVKGKNDLELRDLALKLSPRGLIELPQMAKLTQRLDSGLNRGPTYELPTIPEDKVKYPGNMALKLVDLRKEPLGADVVVNDYPKANYYVGALMNKDEPTLDAFRMVYKNSMTVQPFRDPIFEIFYGERQAEFRKELMEQLRESAKLVVLKKDKNKDAVD